jgi:hemolysin III
MAPSAAPPREKPLLRGVSHEVASAFALAGGVALVQEAAGLRASLAAAVYALALTAQFGVSALYHRPRWGERARLVMRRLDHAAIFLLIAGTYTPICLLLPPGLGRALLAGVWAGAAAGIALSVAWPTAPKALVAGLCVALGWAVVPVIPALRVAIGTGGLALLLGGGVAYTAGAVVYAARRPDPFPRVFGYHEVFHALVVVAAVCHYAAVASVLGALR